MDVGAVKDALSSFDGDQKKAGRQQEAERAEARRAAEKDEQRKADQKRQQEQEIMNPVDRSLVQKHIGMGEALAASILSSVLG